MVYIEKSKTVKQQFMPTGAQLCLLNLQNFLQILSIKSQNLPWFWFLILKTKQSKIRTRKPTRSEISPMSHHETYWTTSTGTTTTKYVCLTHWNIPMTIEWKLLLYFCKIMLTVYVKDRVNLEHVWQNTTFYVT